MPEQSQPCDEQPTNPTKASAESRAAAAVERLLHMVNEASTDNVLSGTSCQGAVTLRVTEGAAHQPGHTPPGYEILAELGRGGGGVVYKARHLKLNRLVALKMILAGAHAGAQERMRFLGEAEAVAALNHPHIVALLDFGEHQGLPFFTLEYVTGGSLAQRLNGVPLPAREPAMLVEQLARAIHYAHTHGIVHRDLKPANVLLSEEGIAKIADFGLARRRDLATGLTATGDVLGTPSYMAPEQASGKTKHAGPAADVYALGAILYECLTGRPPFRAATTMETVLQVLGQEPVSVRHIQPQVPEDLATLCHKCLQKEADKRYGTALELAEDCAAFLEGKPIRARPVSRMERGWRWCRRNPALAGALCLGVVSLLLGSILSLVFAFRAEAARQSEELRAESEARAKNDANQARRDVQRQLVDLRVARRAEAEQRSVADVQREKAEEEKKVAQAVRDFLLNKLLAQTDMGTQADALLKAGHSSSGAKLNPTIRELLDRAAQELAPDKIEESFPKQPLIQAELLQTIGNTYRGIGEYQPAIDFLIRSEALRRQQLGPEHPDTLTSMNNLALAYYDAGKRDLALALFEETLKLRKAKLGPEHPDTLASMDNLAHAYLLAGKLNLALPLFEETLKLRKAKLGPEHPETFKTMDLLTTAYQDAGKLDLALPLFEETLKLRKAKLGPEHPDTSTSMNNLALAYHSAGKLDLAVPLYEETLKLKKVKLGPEHPLTLTTMNNLASAYRVAGKLDLALPLFEDTLKLVTAKLGPEHPDALRSMNNLAGAYKAAGKLDLAMPLYEETLKLQIAKLGPEHPRTLICMGNLAGAYDDLKQFDKAELLYRERLRLEKKRSVVDSKALANALAGLGQHLLYQNKCTEAEPLLRECLAMREEKEPDLWSTFDTKSQLGGALLGQKEHADAEPLLLAGYEGMKKREAKILPWDKIRLTNALDRLVQLYEAMDNNDAAAMWRKELDAIKQLAKETKKP
jgi:eukaryotic-like serine/threonine-protein kinase